MSRFKEKETTLRKVTSRLTTTTKRPIKLRLFRRKRLTTHTSVSTTEMASRVKSKYEGTG